MTQQTAFPYSFDALQPSGPGVETRFQLAMKRRIPCGFFMRVIQRGGLLRVLLWRAYLGSVRRWPLQLAVFHLI